MQVILYDSIDSTNEEARRQLTGPTPPENGTIFMAREQTSGKGQFGRTWFSQPDKHLAMTLVLKPRNVSLNDLAILNMAVALGTRRAIMETEPKVDIRIKWPNDLYIGNQKLGGILIENLLSTSTVSWMIIGIGVNVQEERFPPGIENAISIYQITGRHYQKSDLALLIRDLIFQEMESNAKNILDNYNEHLFGKGLDFHFQQEQEMRKGKVQGVDQKGRLLILGEDRETSAYSSHEIKWIIA